MIRRAARFSDTAAPARDPGAGWPAPCRANVLALLPAKMRQLPDEDWLEQDSLVACPDPDERLVMRIERIGERALVTEELT